MLTAAQHRASRLAKRLLPVVVSALALGWVLGRSDTQEIKNAARPEVLGVLLPVLPISGRVDPRQAIEFTTQFYLIESIVRGEIRVLGMLLTHLVLPAAALALPLMAVITRMFVIPIFAAFSSIYLRCEAEFETATRDAFG